MKKNRSNQMIEIMRFISCIVILLIHCELPEDYRSYIMHYGRFAVPFFLLVSGYFAYGADISKKSSKKARQILHLILTHGTICVFWNCINSYLSNGSFTGWSHQYFTSEYLWYFAIYNRAIFINSAFYYLFMILYVYLLCVVIFRIEFISIYHIYVIAACLFLVGYYKFQFTEIPWYAVGNFLYMGIPLFFLGHFFHSRPGIFRAAKGKEIPIILLGAFITYLEYTILKDTFLSFGQIAIASGILCICINNRNAKGGLLAFLGSRCSMYVMLYHCQIRDTARIFIGPHPFRVALVTLIGSLSVAIIVDSAVSYIMDR